MPNFEDMNEQRLVDGEDDEDDYSNDLIYQENHCYSMQKNNQKNQPQTIYMNKIKKLNTGKPRFLYPPLTLKITFFLRFKCWLVRQKGHVPKN